MSLRPSARSHVVYYRPKNPPKISNGVSITIVVAYIVFNKILSYHGRSFDSVSTRSFSPLCLLLLLSASFLFLFPVAFLSLSLFPFSPFPCIDPTPFPNSFSIFFLPFFGIESRIIKTSASGQNKSNRTTMRPLGIYVIGISIYILNMIRFWRVFF